MKAIVRHSQTRPVWKVVNTSLGETREVAEVPYVEGVQQEKDAAVDRAAFIAECFNNYDEVIKFITFLKDIE